MQHGCCHFVRKDWLPEVLHPKIPQSPQDFVCLFIIGSYAMRVTKNKNPNGLSFYIIRPVDGVPPLTIE